MGVRWLCKHSVHGKKSPLPKGDLVDRLTGQNNGFGLGGTEKKSGEGYCEEIIVLPPNFSRLASLCGS